jgi:dTDP-4-amino-4,6-dideoxy-D-galactose acyltransferase
MITELTWDSNLFGFKVGFIDPVDLKSESLENHLKYAKESKFRLIYLNIDENDYQLNSIARGNNCFLASQKQTYKMSVNSAYAFEDSPNVILYTDKNVSEDLLILALQSGHMSKYKKDPGFTLDQFKKLYTIWIERSVRREIANFVAIYKGDEKILGFITLLFEEQTGKIGLVGVDEKSRGKGIGRQLIQYVITQCLINKCSELSVVTQRDNIAAVGLYIKSGFSLYSTQNNYHFWL